ncbi:amino acid adenylation [Calothrix brevissima NIES-22]|nr:amino acid adenylation [Calothrix brevissima NIES-22]
MGKYRFELPFQSSTLVELLRKQSQHQPQKIAYSFLLDGEQEKADVSYGELDCQARAIAALLQSYGVKRGERALLLYPPGLEFIAAFFGCLYAGVVAVPVYPPRLNKSLSRLESVIVDAQTVIALTTKTVIERQFPLSENLKNLQLIATDNIIVQDFAPAWQEPTVNSDTLAFLQYTSGSTGTPKGVMVSHGNLLHNQQLIAQGMQHTDKTLFVGWLPLFHDMGLVGNLLQPLYLGIPCILMSPVAFLEKPYRWLKAISQYQATTSGGPNFAYDLCVQKITPEQRETLDLSSWEVAFNGSETVRAQTLERFATTFADCGFRQEAFYPCYGMAETTLIVSGGLKTAPPHFLSVQKTPLRENLIVPASAEEINVQTLVSCGQPLQDLEIVIADPETKTHCAANEVGEIWVKGSSVTLGYWNSKEQTQQTFQAYLKDSGEGSFLRTGDLGFLWNGELYITGRLKDLIVIRGRNHYPQDIEKTVEQSHPALQLGSSAAFSVEVQDTEKLVVAIEVKRTYLRHLPVDEVINSIRQAVVEEHELQVYGVLLLKTGTIPKTSSGKIQRYACRAGFLHDSLDIVGSSIFAESSFNPREEKLTREALLELNIQERHLQLTNYLQAQVAQVLKIEQSQLDVQQPLSSLGIDSLMAIELKNCIETNLGVVVPITSFLEGASIDRLVKEILAKLTSTPEINPISTTAENSLAYGQRSLYFLHQLNPESPAYNIAGLARIQGELDVTALQVAFQSLLERHASLRSSFHNQLGEIYQQIHGDIKVYFDTGNVADVGEASLNHRLSQEAYRPFNLEESSLLRVSLFRRSPQEHTLLLVVHHIVADFWSIAVLIQELGILYEAQKAGIPANLKPLKLQYSDYVHWQKAMLASQVGKDLLSYWQKQLAGELSVLNLPTDKPRSTIKSDRGASIPFRFSLDLTQKLKTLSQTNGTTLYMTLLAAFQVLLYRYTSQEDILVGSPTTGRSRANMDSIVGYFVNPVVLRANLAGNPTFAEFLQQVRITVLDAFQHQDYPFAELVEQLVAVRDPSRSPLFQVMFVWQKSHLVNQQELAAFALGETGAKITIGDLQLESLAIEQSIAQFDLTLNMAEVEGSLCGSWQYSTDLFVADTITRMAGNFQTLVEGIIADQEQHISALPILSKKEQHQLLVEWNATQVDYASNLCLHQQFEEFAARTPDAIALVYEQERLTYQQLNQRANQLAHYLQTLGVKPEVLVGIYLERSVAMIVSILAILKAGGAYVPLDPTYPQERIAFMLEDAQVGVLLTQENLLENLPQYQTGVVCLDKEGETLLTQRIDNPHSKVTTNNLAYVIYTSGSTGKPKGVLVNHQNVLRLFAATQSWFNFSDRDIWTNFHSYAFDFSVWEIWGAFLYGGRLVVVPYWISRSPQAFYNLLSSEQVTVLNQTPSAFRQLMRAEEQISENAKSLNLRLVIFGGEALELQSLQPWFDRHGDVKPQLVNMYGITETTVHVTYHPITLDDLRKYTNSIIGRPIPDLEIYLLDGQQQPVPIGVAGEIYIGGAGVARGYLHRPELDVERFINHPFSQVYGARLYKSGDLARYLSNGELEYLGRIDHQVKIRGFRIEISEIEAVLCQHPAVKEAIAVVREAESDKKPLMANLVTNVEDNSAITELRRYLKGELTTPETIPTDKRLVAYCVIHQQPAPSITELRRFLGEKLPDYMVPSAFVILPALPLTANGKIDRKALPAPSKARPDIEKAFVAPRTSIEQTLAEIWTQVLDIEQVGIDDNFFELGGDSIRSIQMRGLAQAKGLNFSLQQIFQHQTIYKLAQEISVAEPISSLGQKTEPFSLISESERQKLPEDIEDAYPLARIQAGLIFHSQYSPESAIYHDIFLCQLQVRLEVELFQTAIQQVVNRHPNLRTSYDLTNFSEPLQLVHRNVYAPLQVEDMRSRSPGEQQVTLANWIETEKTRNFDWTSPPLIRFFIHRLSDESFYLILSCHNSILDGWSKASLITELLHRYYALLEGNKYPIASAPRISYRDFVALERETLASPICHSYWMQKLPDCVTTKVPSWCSVPRTSDQVQIGVLDVPISPQLSDGLKKLANIAEVPLKNVLLAGHLFVMSLLSGNTEVMTGFECNGRLEEADGDKVLGIHLNTVPLRVQLLGGSWIDLVKQAFDAERELLPFRRYPYADLQKLTGRQPRQPLVETVFNYTHFHVYQSTQTLKDLDIVGAKGFGETHYVLRAEFNRNHASDRIQLDLECNLLEIGQEQLEAIGSYYIETLTAMTTQPFAGYESQCLLPAREKHQLLVEWNNIESFTQRRIRRSRSRRVGAKENWSIQQQFEEEVSKNPEAIAVVFGDEQLSYQELNCRANILAHHLRRLGVGADVPVAICVERSLEMLVGILAILKAGGAYVPLDPTYPAEHLAFILKDAQISVLLTQAHLLAKLPPHEAQVFCLDSQWHNLADESIDNPVNTTIPENLAYIIYTSGSTGKPKGVQITHQNLLHSTNARIAYYQEPVTRFLLLPSFAFDSSVACIFWTICQGGSLVILKEGLQRDIWQLAKAIAQHQISHWLSVPSLYSELLAHINPAELISLQTVIVAGEACNSELVQRHYELLPHTSLFNEYGPTEATVWSTVYNCQHHDSRTPVPIGNAIANTQIYILNSYRQPVPIGVPGEIYIGGLGLAKGYLNNPELTALKFIPNPFSQEPNAHLYKTGDLGRYLPDGNIEFLGRIDHQVKLRGYRIELTAIEAVLQQHPLVQEVVVTVREESETKRLIAYIVPEQNPAPTKSELQHFLKQKLPDYMIPHTFVTLETLPLTPSGKIDRRNLPAPEQVKPVNEKMTELLTILETLSEEQVKVMLAKKKLSI